MDHNIDERDLRLLDGDPYTFAVLRRILRAPCELLLIAAGFIGCDARTAETFDLRADFRGRLMSPNQTHFLGGNLFSAGDMRTGQSLVVRALADGRAAGKEIDNYLRGNQP